MNFNMDLYDKTEAKEFGDYENLELGGHEIVILDAREYTSEFSGNTSLKVCVDIAGNDKQKDYFQKQYDNNTNSDKKWSTSATKFLSLKDEQLAYLKGFITAVEKSNSGFIFNKKGAWEQLKGKKLAGQFGLEEYTKQDGTTGTSTKLIQFRSLDKLNEIKIPKVKLLDGSYVEYNDYKNKNTNHPDPTEFSDVVEIDGELPF